MTTTNQKSQWEIKKTKGNHNGKSHNTTTNLLYTTTNPDTNNHVRNHDKSPTTMTLL